MTEYVLSSPHATSNAKIPVRKVGRPRVSILYWLVSEQNLSVFYRTDVRLGPKMYSREKEEMGSRLKSVSTKYTEQFPEIEDPGRLICHIIASLYWKFIISKHLAPASLFYFFFFFFFWLRLRPTS